jgi:hypothetical protein
MKKGQSNLLLQRLGELVSSCEFGVKVTDPNRNLLQLRPSMVIHKVNTYLSEIETIQFA